LSDVKKVKKGKHHITTRIRCMLVVEYGVEKE
jgi:hypothetical protein